MRRYRCSGCGYVWRQDTTAAAEPKAKLSRRALRWAVTAAAAVAAEGTDPSSDLNAQADYRQHLARVLTGRAVATAAGMA